MKIQLTNSYTRVLPTGVEIIQAGIVVDLPDAEALDLLEKDVAILVQEKPEDKKKVKK